MRIHHAHQPNEVEAGGDYRWPSASVGTLSQSQAASADSLNLRRVRFGQLRTFASRQLRSTGRRGLRPEDLGGRGSQVPLTDKRAGGDRQPKRALGVGIA